VRYPTVASRLRLERTVSNMLTGTFRIATIASRLDCVAIMRRYHSVGIRKITYFRIGMRRPLLAADHP
jgi:hypothetical protein